MPSDHTMTGRIYVDDKKQAEAVRHVVEGRVRV
jgi:hypothetical protein